MSLVAGVVLLNDLREEGFAADAAADCEEGFDKAMNRDYAVIALDLMMRVLNGPKLRTRGRTTI